MLLPTKTEKNHHTRTITVKEVGTTPVQSNLCALQLVLIAVVLNRITM